MLEFNSIADFESSLTQHHQELESLRQVFTALSEHVTRLHHRVVDLYKICQRLDKTIHTIETRQRTLEQAQRQGSTLTSLGRRIFTACTSVLNWCQRKFLEAVVRFNQHPH